MYSGNNFLDNLKCAPLSQPEFSESSDQDAPMPDAGDLHDLHQYEPGPNSLFLREESYPGE